LEEAKLRAIGREYCLLTLLRFLEENAVKNFFMLLVVAVCLIGFTTPNAFAASGDVGLIVQSLPVECDISVTKIGFPENKEHKTQDKWVDVDIAPGIYVVSVSSRGKTLRYDVEIVPDGMVHLFFNCLVGKVKVVAEARPEVAVVKEVVKKADKAGSSSINSLAQELKKMNEREKALQLERNQLAQMLVDPPATMTMADITATLSKKQGLELKITQLQKKKLPVFAAFKAERKKKFEQDYAQYSNLIRSGELGATVEMMAWKEVCKKWRVSPGKKPGQLMWNESRGVAEVFVPPSIRVHVTPRDAVASLLVATGSGSSRLKSGVSATLDAKNNYTLSVSKAGHKAHVEALSADWSGLKEIWVELKETKDVYASLGGGVQMELIWLPSGEFRMGSNAGDLDERPEHNVSILRPFWIAATEVTQRQYYKVMGGHTSHFTGANHPAEKVSWYDAVKFCQKLTEIERVAGRLPEGYEYTLPTEAQWEYAARAGTKANYAGNLESMAWYSSNAGETTHPVGLKKPNAWGLFDMHGNVWEWCLDDWHKAYHGAPTDGSRWGDGSHSYRVARGGGWGDRSASCRSANRYDNTPSFTFFDLGFRPVLTLQQ
jgi:formylglycine-generating enzyme required for sulfatase activity